MQRHTKKLISKSRELRRVASLTGAIRFGGGATISYVDEYYIMGRVRRIGKDGRIVRTEPLYPPSLWSIYDKVLSNVPRTTNQIEAWHRRWQTLVARQTGVIKLMGELRLEEKYTVGQIAALLAGTSSKQKKTMHQINDHYAK